MRKVTLFVSSPGDVEHERCRVDHVAQRLNGEFADAVCIETVRWETKFYEAYTTYQSQIPEAATCDLVLGIFWSRLGTALPAEFPCMGDGTPYPSGSAYEVLSSIAARKNGARPDVYVFKKTAKAVAEIGDAEKLNEAESQWSRLEQFFQQWFLTAEGTFRSAFQRFETTDAFEAEVEQLLRQWLAQKVLSVGPAVSWPIALKGSPFRGLDVFDAGHADVFFGRARDTKRAIERLMAAAGRGTQSLLVIGPSGAGKSSLVRAGAMPHIIGPGGVPDVDVWRVATMRPGGGATPIDALAEALFAGAKGSAAAAGDAAMPALPEIAAGDYKTVKELAALMHAGADAAVVPVMRALDRIGADARAQGGFDRAVRADLLLVVDQLDDLFSARVTPADRALFAKTLAALVATKRVWLITTLRADLYEHVLAEPDLIKLKHDGAEHDLSPPGDGDLADIVRKPAEAAGLVYEADPKTGESLDDRLLREAGSADTLPLLQFTLQRLFEERKVVDGKTLLTVAAYESFGGIEGALREEGEAALKKANLGKNSELVLARLVRALTAYDRERQVLTQQPARRSSVVTDADSQRLVEALLERRILVADDADLGDGDYGTLHLAHEAVLRAWPALSRHLDSAKLYRSVVAECALLIPGWKEKRCAPFWRRRRASDELLRGIELEEARKVIRLFASELDGDTRAFIQASDVWDRRRSYYAVGTAIGAIVLAVLALTFGIDSAIQRANSIRNYSGAAIRVVDSIRIEIADHRSDMVKMPKRAVLNILNTYSQAIDNLVGPAGDDADLKHSQELMLREFGDLYAAIGHRGEARSAYNAALAIATDLARRRPAEIQPQIELALLTDRLKALGE